MSQRRFDADYYRRYYGDRVSRVFAPEDMQRRARIVALQLKEWRVPVRRILDAGCGLGLMRDTLLEEFPGARFTGLEVSEYLCERFGWIQASVADYRPSGSFDLVICYDVLQYLSDRDAARALANVGRLCRGALYFQAPTAGDYAHNADREYSDVDAQFRPMAWYQSRLRRRFRHMGSGLHLRRDVPAVQWELEAPWR